MIQSRLLLGCGCFSGLVLSFLLSLNQCFADSVTSADLMVEDSESISGPTDEGAGANSKSDNQRPPLQYTATLSSEQVRALYAETSWVSYVRVSQVRQKVDVALSMPGMYVLEGYRYNLAVLNQWKGDGLGFVQLDVAVKDCPLMLEEAGEYIVFAQGAAGNLTSNQCMQMVAYKANNQAVDVLNNLYRQSLAVAQ